MENETLGIVPDDGTKEGSSQLSDAVMDALSNRLGERMDEYVFPPPVFVAMQGEFLEFDLDDGSLTARFPVLGDYLNPFGTMQGGVVAAAVDNTLGPLSVLVAPRNVTRRLEVTYSRPITPDLGHIIVVGKLLERAGRRLFFKADVRDEAGVRLARAKAVHWVVDEAGGGETEEGE